MSQRWQKIRIWAGALVALIVSVSVVVLTSPAPTHAANNAMVEKSKLYALSQCYTNSFITPVDTTGGRWFGTTSLVFDMGYTYFVYSGAPTSTMMNCTQIVDSYQNKVPSASAPADTISTFLKNIGYKENTSSGSGNDTPCAIFTFTKDKEDDRSVTLCMPTSNGSEDGTIQKGAKASVDYRGNKVVQMDQSGNSIKLDCKLGFLQAGAGGCHKITYEPEKTTLRLLATNIANDMKTAAANNGGKLTKGWAPQDKPSYSKISREDRSFDKGNSAAPAVKYFSGGSYTSMEQLGLTNEEIGPYLLDSLQNNIKYTFYLGADTACRSLSDADRENAIQSGYTRVSLGENYACYIKPVDETYVTPGYAGIGGDSTHYFDGTPFAPENVMSELNRIYGLPDELSQDEEKQKCNDNAAAALSTIERLLQDSHTADAYRQKLRRAKQGIDNILRQHGAYWHMEEGVVVCYDLPDLSPPGQENTPTPNPGDDDGPPQPGQDDVTNGSSDFTACLNQVGSLGWILCPTLSLIKGAAESFYDSIVTDWLPVESNLVTNNSGIYEGWKVFRNAANIVFVIMLVIILLSQISGFGVSNYGIKKMLPSLIVVAVLVNVSYLLCQLLVDVTNIVGAEIGQILSNIGGLGGNSGTAFETTGGTVVKGAISVIFSAAGIGVGASVALEHAGALGMIVLVFGIGILISSFFFFAILALRKAAVFVCIIVAPLAIICYALPNTKNLFDRWKKLFMAVLLVYPICQVVVGGGQMVSKLMLGQDQNGFIYNIVAVILSFAPIFLIPSILSNSLAGLGNIGSRVSQLGRRLNSLATRRVGNSDLVKRARIAGDNWSASRGQAITGRVNERLRNMRGIGGLVTRVEDGAVGRAIGSRRDRNAARARQAYRKQRLEDAEAKYLSSHMTNETLQNDLNAQDYRQEQEQIANTIQSYRDNGVNYDGSTANANDIDGLSDALEYYMKLYDSDTDNEDAKIRAQALTNMMMESGDPGRSKLMGRLKKHNFDADTGKDLGTQSFSSLADYINRNQKWMAGLKAADRGSFNMITHGAERKPLENLQSYNAGVGRSIAANGAAIHELGDSFYDGLESAKQAGLYDYGSSRYNADAAESLIQMRDAFQAALSDPATAKGLTAKDITNMNKVGKMAHDLEVAQGIATGPYQEYKLGETLKIPHSQDRATMPQGWVRAESNTQVGNAWIKRGDWVQTDSAGNITGKLSVKDSAQADALERQINEAEAWDNAHGINTP